MHILIVEDEVGIVQFLKQGLEEEGYKITCATDGLKGFELIQKEKFDLLLLDWMLPKMTGLEPNASRLKYSISFKIKSKKELIFVL